MGELGKVQPAERTFETARGKFEAVGLLEGLEVGVVVQGPDADIWYANELALDLLGRSRDQVLGTTSSDPQWDVVRPDGSPFAPQDRPVGRVLATGRPAVDIVLGVRRRNGERAWLLANAKPQFAAGVEQLPENVEYVVVTLSDISSERRRMGLLQQVADELEIAVSARTAELASSVDRLEREVEERRRVEAALARSESMYRSVLRAMAEGVAIHDATGEIEYANPAALRVLGLTEEQLRGREGISPEWSLIRTDGSPLPPEEIPSEITRTTGEACTRHLLGVRTGDGLRAWLEVSTEPVESVAAGPSAPAGHRVVATFTDVTQARTTTAALERSRARFKRVTEAVPGVLFQLRRAADGTLTLPFVSAQAGELFGMPVGHSVEEVQALSSRVHPDDRASLLRSFERAVERAGIWEVDFRVLTQDGEWRWVRTRGTPERVGDDLVWSGIILDITEERSLAEQVQVAQRREAIAAVTAGIAHNFNNALAVLVPNLEECLDQAPTGLEQPLEESLRTARAAAGLVRQLMTIARGSLTDEGSDLFDPVAVATDVLALCRGLFQSRINIEAQLDLHSARVRGSDAAFHQVLLNLCLNARDALQGRASPLVEIGVGIERRDGASRANTFVLSVRDNGHGMSAEQVARLGEPFFTTKPPGEGTGLGLATSYASVRDMGGDIECHSIAGEGTEFRVVLPLADCLSATNAPVDPSGGEPQQRSFARFAVEPSAGNHPRRRVLMIDDDELVRGAMARMLERRGYAVVEASNGVHGLSFFAADAARFDAVLLDLSMPGMPGERVLEQLAHHHPNIPVIVLSGFVESSEELENAAAILNKPVSSLQITTVLNEIIASRSCSAGGHAKEG